MSASTNIFDIAVVGCGALGSALVCALAERGAKVCGIDRFHPPHDRGSSHGRTRITRLAVGEGEAFVPLVQRSHARWRELEAASGESLMLTTGALTLGSPATEAALFHGRDGFFARTAALARRFGIAHELLDARAIRERFPAFTPADDESGYFEPGGGVLFPERCVAVQLQRAAGSGAVLRMNECLHEISSTAGGVALRTDRGTVHAARVVLATGAWLPKQTGLASELRVLRQVLHWFAVERRDWYVPGRCPVFIWPHGPSTEDSMYGFPLADDVPGVKVAMEQMSVATDPDTVDRVVAPAEAQAMFARHLQGRLRGLLPRPVAGATCLYTMANDGNFIVDRHPQPELQERVTIVSPCSGHGFKHSAGLGEALAQQLLGETPFTSLAPFARGRAAA